MKLPPVTLSFLAFLLSFTACSKSGRSSLSTENQLLGAGDWNLVTDSTFEGVAQNNHPVDYTGQPGDYFKFTTDGHVYTREGEVLDTLTYQMVSDSTIIISGFAFTVNGVSPTDTIKGLGSNSLTANTGNFMDQTIVIESPWFPTPGGLFWRKVTLSR
jgi:hypothetical protein